MGFVDSVASVHVSQIMQYSLIVQHTILKNKIRLWYGNGMQHVICKMECSIEMIHLPVGVPWDGAWESIADLAVYTILELSLVPLYDGTVSSRGCTSGISNASS